MADWLQKHSTTLCTTALSPLSFVFFCSSSRQQKALWRGFRSLADAIPLPISVSTVAWYDDSKRKKKIQSIDDEFAVNWHWLVWNSNRITHLLNKVVMTNDSYTMWWRTESSHVQKSPNDPNGFLKAARRRNAEIISELTITWVVIADNWFCSLTYGRMFKCDVAT